MTFVSLVVNRIIFGSTWYHPTTYRSRLYASSDCAWWEWFDAVWMGVRSSSRLFKSTFAEDPSTMKAGSIHSNGQTRSASNRGFVLFRKASLIHSKRCFDPFRKVLRSVPILCLSRAEIVVVVLAVIIVVLVVIIVAFAAKTRQAHIRQRETGLDGHRRNVFQSIGNISALSIKLFTEHGLWRLVRVKTILM